MKKIIILSFLLLSLGFTYNISEVKADGINCVPFKVFYIKNFKIEIVKKDNCGFGMTDEIIEKQRIKQEKEFNKYIINLK